MKKKMKLFDLHCDTATRLYEESASLWENGFHISLERSAVFEKYVQLTAVFTEQSLSDEEGWIRFHEVRRYLEEEADKYGVRMIRSAGDLRDFDRSDGKTAFILTVEDARILNGRPERVKELYDCGVRVITPLWGGKTIIGGSHDTDEGLTPFGREAVREMTRVGILPDISHASFKAADEIMDICEEAGIVPLATHMNAYAVRAHSRNLTDGRFRRLASLGGIAGVSLCVMHLTGAEESSAADVTAHLMHYEKTAKGHAAFGCDYDGTDVPPVLHHIDALPLMRDRLAGQGMTQEEIDAVFYGTACGYMLSNLPEDA